MKIIPIFIPHAGCSYRCIYCDQRKISGADKIPSIEEIHSIIERNLMTIPKGERIEAAFFGGTFTLLPEDLQRKYLEAVYPYVKSKKISGIRMSTHPEAISRENMNLFKKKGGYLVELGIQSLDKDVLKKSGRLMALKTVENAVKHIKDAGLELGVQVMLGLPGDTLEKSIKTAKALIKFRPKTARIYPTLVIKGTKLAELYKKGKYKPLSMGEAVDWASKISDIFEKRGVKVIRIGLHPSRGLNSGKIMLAGPYHVNFGQMVRSRRTRDKIIKAAPHIVIIDPRMPRQAKERLKKMNFYAAEAPLHKKLADPIKGHPDMMLFKHGNKVIYEPSLEKIAGLLRDNGYECVKGAAIKSKEYPKDIIYNACVIGDRVIRYEGAIEKNIENLRCKSVKVKQGYVKCSIIPVDDKHIITSDKGIFDKCRVGAISDRPLLVKSGHVKLPGYKSGFIGGASGVYKDNVFFVGSLKYHPDGDLIRDYVKSVGKNVIELYDGPLYDVGSILFFEVNTSRS